MKTLLNAAHAGLATGALIVVLAGCGGPAPAAPITSQATTTTSTAPTTTTTKSVLAAAADGVNYAACASRSCEVTVSKPVGIRFGGSAPGTLSITKVAPDGVDIDLTLRKGGGGSGTLKPGCSTFVFGSAGGSGSLAGPNTDCATKPPSAQPGVVTVQLPAMIDGTAILRIVIG